MIIQSKKVWIADQFISAAVELEQGKITGIFPYGEKQADVDYVSKRIVPGFMDIHCQRCTRCQWGCPWPSVHPRS